MSIGWVIFIIILVLGVIVSNLLLLKQTANMKIPDDVLKAIKEKKQRELNEQASSKEDNKNEAKKKPE